MRTLLTKNDAEKVCIIYAQGKIQGSIDHQVWACETYAKEHGYTVARIITDFGGNYRRCEILEEAENGEFDTLLIYDYSRLGRRVDQVYAFCSRLHNLGVKIKKVEGAGLG